MAATGGHRRIEVLARSKPIPGGFQEDRRSVYWIERLPPRPGPNGTTEFAVNARQGELARHRDPHVRWQGDKLTPIWPVSRAAQSGTASGRVEVLAEARPVHSEYKYRRSVYTSIPEAALTANCSGRLEQLSVPKPHKVWANSHDTIDLGPFSEPLTPVGKGALKGRCSGRLEALADCKSEHTDYHPERPVKWAVSDTAKNAIATVRLQQMARPKSGRTINDDYDPYKVTSAARNTRPSPRVTELAMPIPRKVRAKKM